MDSAHRRTPDVAVVGDNTVRTPVAPATARSSLRLARLAAVVSIACSGLAQAGACHWTPVSVNPADKGIYSGQAAAVELRLTDDRPDARVEVFADSDLALRRLPDGPSCTLAGGVWSRKGFHVSADGRTLAALESSGSNDSLVFVDTARCARVGSVDVSNSHWTLHGRDLRLEPTGATARSKSRVRLNASCRPPAGQR